MLTNISDINRNIDSHVEFEHLDRFSQAVLENMPGGYHICAAEEGYPFLYISDRFCEMFGWTREEIETEFDNKFMNMLHPEDTETTRQYIELLRQSADKNVVDAIYRMRGKHGYIWVSDATSLVTVGDQRFYQGTLTDITGFVAESQKRDELLREQLSIFDSLARGFQNVFWINLTDGTAKILKLGGYITSGLDKEDHKFFDYPTTLNAYISERVHPEDTQMLYEKLCLEHLRKVFEKRSEYTGNYRVLIDGEVHHYQYNLIRTEGVEFVTCGFQNIDAIIEEHLEAERIEKEKEAAHQKEVAEQMAIIDTLSKSFKNVFVANLNSGTARVVRLAEDYDVNAVIAVKGKVFPFDFVIKQWIQENVHPDDKEKVAEAFSFENLRSVFSERDEYSGTYRSTEGGKLHHYQFDFRKSDDNGNVVAGFQIIDAIVEEHEQQAKREREHQEALMHALAAAQQANRAKTTFLNSMSHDIRTPMNAIIGFTALAQAHSDDRAQVQDYLAKISTSSTHLLSLINDILDMSRIESGTVKLEETAVHIPDLMHDLRTMIQGLIKAKNQNLFIDTQDVVHEDILTDKLRLNQVLLNIVGNAIKFTKPGGDIMIRLREKPCHLKSHTTYEFSVKDNGIGMSKKFIGHIFDTFSREYTSTVSGIQGTGLGMAITKNIVDMMGGDISVESEEGKGSTFTVTLHMKIGNEYIKNEPIPELLGAKVLIVDDDMDTCRSVSKMLRDIQMRPDWTTSGKEAVVRAQDAAEMMDEYKVYIIDYLMPDMNGIETVRRIRKVIREEVPIIVLTAYDWSDFEHEAREAGVTAFVSKPIFVSELRNVLLQPENKEGRENAEEKIEKKMYQYSGKRVLLVEDNELNREIATAILEESGMIVDSVNDGDIAVSTINKAASDQYDLIFMDVQMPKMDGYTATREIRTLPDNRKANIPIVAMTANAFEEDKRKSYESGMNGHIIKPISMEAIAKVLDAIFAIKKV